MPPAAMTFNVATEGHGWMATILSEVKNRADPLLFIGIDAVRYHLTPENEILLILGQRQAADARYQPVSSSLIVKPTAVLKINSASRCNRRRLP